MRSAYLKQADDVGGCRGGVGSNFEDYALEIGKNCYADPEMLALCTVMDEIKEFLETSPSYIGRMILQQWKEETKRLAFMAAIPPNEGSQQ